MRVTTEKRHYLWLQSRALENDHAEMVAQMITHGFNGVIVLPGGRLECLYPTEIFPQSERRVNGEHLFPHFARLARDAGLQVLAWMLVGEWPRWSHMTTPHPEWNMRNAGHDRDWLNLTLPEVREAVVGAAREMLEIAGVHLVLDYIRMRTGMSELHPHVTRTVQDVREMMEAEFRGRELLASVFGVAGGRPSATLNQQNAQRWPSWLPRERNLVDGVLAMMHHHPDTLHAALAGMPTSGVSIMSTPGGGSRFNPEPFTEDEFRRVLDIIETSRFGLPTMWRKGLMKEHHWRVYQEYTERYSGLGKCR